MTVRDLCTEALTDIGVASTEQPPTATDIDTALSNLNRLLDDWNADRRAVYAAASDSFVLTTGLNPQSIGPTGATFTVAQRPVDLLAANILLTTSNPVTRQPLEIIDAQTYATAIRVPALQSSYPNVVYYQPDWPNGNLYFYPVPSAAYGLELWYRVLLSSVGLTDTFSMPPGYRNAITLTLEEMLVRPFTRQMPATLPEEARKARARVFANNDVTPILITRDAGMTAGANGARADFNFLTGQVQ